MSDNGKTFIMTALCVMILGTGCATGRSEITSVDSQDNRISAASSFETPQTDLDNEILEEDTEYDTFEPLTEADLEAVTQFIRRSDVYGFLCSEYGKVEDVSLGNVFYMGLVCSRSQLRGR